MRPVRHYEFIGALRQWAQSSGARSIALRLDGEVTDANLVLRRDGQAQEAWRVGHNGARTRSDTWNMYTQMSTALPLIERSDVYTVFEHAINFIRFGWVVVTFPPEGGVTAEWKQNL